MLSFIMVLLALPLSAQNDSKEDEEKINILFMEVFDGDTFVPISEVSIRPLTFDNSKDELDYKYYLKRVRKVYPYYLISKEIMSELEEQENELRRRQFKKYKKDRKKELFREFEKELRGLTKSEGKVLVKMINRDTGMNFYDLLVQYNSRVKAWTYNIVANRNDYNLKEPYNPEAEENRMLEVAIQQVQKTYDERSNPLKDRI